MYRNGLFFAFLSVCLFAAPQEGIVQEILPYSPAVEETAEDETADSQSLFDELAAPDRSTMRRFEQAQRLIEANRLPEAAQLLGAVLESSADAFLEPSSADASERTSLRTFSGLVLKTLLGLPGKARQSYTAQYEPLAARLLDNAVQNGSIEEIQLIAKRYAPTQAGRTALFLHGLNQFETGMYQPALLTLQKLNNSQEDLTPFEPALSVTLAACSLRCGLKTEAKQFAQQLFQRQPKPEILLSGKEQWKPENADEVLQRLEQMLEQAPKVTPSAWLEQTGWQLSSGTANQNPDTAATKPLLDFIWTVPAFSRRQLNGEAKTLAYSTQRKKETLMPTGQPILADGKFIFRGMKDKPEIIAVDAQSGKRLWTAAEPELSLPNIGPLGNIPIRALGMQQMLGGQNNNVFLRLFLWHTKLASQFSSSGQQLYSVEGTPPLSERRMGGFFNQRIQINGKTMDNPQAGPGNTLIARDIDTGRVLWQVGKFPYVQKKFDIFFQEVIDEKQKKTAPINAAPPQPEEQQAQQAEPQRDEPFSEEELFLAETWFLGAPLPLHGRLYVLGENGGIIRLIVLDAVTGHFLRQQPLATPSSSFESDDVRRRCALTPSESNGIILCPTGTGMVFAIDAVTVTPLWSFSYLKPSPKTEEQINQQRMMQEWAFAGMNNPPNQFYHSRWQIPSLMMDGNRAVITPADDSSVYCLDIMTGKLLWQWKKEKEETEGRPSTNTLPKGFPLYAACVYNGTVYLIYDDSVSALALDTGKERELTLPSEFSFKVSGRGVHSGHQYFLPFSGGVLGTLDLNKGTLEYFAAKPEVLARAVNSQTAPENSEDAGSVEGANPVLSSFDTRSHTSSDLFFDSPVELGNLIGIQGRFFSQSPMQAACFDQLEPLQKRTDALLQANPDDATGLYQLGRIKRSEGDLRTAADLFRRSCQANRTEWAAGALRQTLLELIRGNYTDWSRYNTELESLAEFPEELGEILFVLACGAAQNGNLEETFDKIRKAFFLEQNDMILVPLNAQHFAQSQTALGILLQESLKKPPKTNSESSWNSQLNAAAETLLNEVLSDNGNRLSVRQPSMLSLLQKQDGETEPLSADVQSLRNLSTLFQSLPVASKIESLLIAKLEQNRLAAAAEMVIQGKHGDKKTAVNELRTLAELFDSQGNVADALYYAQQILKTGSEENVEKYRTFMERPDVQKCFARYYAPVSFPNGIVQVVEGEPDGFQTDFHNARSTAITRILQEANRRNEQFQVMNINNRREVPFHGTYDPFLSSLSFALEVYHPDIYLVCSDSYGKEIWRRELSDELSGESGYWHNDYYSFMQNGFFDQMVYLKGWRHLLILVQHNVLVAFDTSQYDAEKGPKILWKKNLTVPLPTRQSYSASSFNQLIGAIQNPSYCFPKQPLFVSPQVVCYQDSDKVYGLDPLTGETMWVREMESTFCSLLGDQEHLFLVFPDTQRVIAVNPLNGSERESGTIPQGGAFVFGTQIVFVKQIQQVGSAERVFPYQLHVCDLKDLYDKRRRALLISDGGEKNEGTLPTVPVFTQLSYETLIRQVHHGRFLCSASWDSQTVQLFDLQERKDIWKDKKVGLPPRVTNNKNPRWDSDIDVELLDGNFLVTFVESTQDEREGQGIELVDDGRKIRRRSQTVHGVPLRKIGDASMMLYGTDGKALWEEPARIEGLYRMMCTPPKTPVALFTAVFHDEELQAPRITTQTTAIQAIDKRTGQTRFRKTIPVITRNQQQTLLQGFRVETEPNEKTVSFIAVNRKINAVFTDKPKAAPPAPAAQKPEKTGVK